MSSSTVAEGLGAEVRRRRESQGLTLEALGERSGLTPNYIGGVELGRRDPSLSTLLALSRGLGVPTEELFAGAGDMGPASLEAGRLFDELVPEARSAVLMLFRSLAAHDARKARR